MGHLHSLVFTGNVSRVRGEIRSSYLDAFINLACDPILNNIAYRRRRNSQRASPTDRTFGLQIHFLIRFISKHHRVNSCDG